MSMTNCEKRHIYADADDIRDIQTNEYNATGSHSFHYAFFSLHGRVNKKREKIAIGKSNNIPQYNVPSLHAEIDALNKTPKYYFGKRLDLYVFGFTNTGKLSSSRPCFHCLNTLMQYNIKYVYYSVDGDICKEKFSEMLSNNLTKISSGVRRKHK